MRNWPAVTTRLQSAITSETAESMETLGDELELLVVDTGEVSESFLEAAREALDSALFLSRADSWRLPRFLFNNYETLSEHQRQGLRSILVASFGKFSDWLGSFCVAELLAEKIGDDEALASLLGWFESSVDTERECGKHGLQILAREARDPLVRQAAARSLVAR